MSINPTPPFSGQVATSWQTRACLLVGSSVVCGIMLLLAEASVRLLTDVPLFGIDKQLVAPLRFGESFGNAPGVSALAFGTLATIDQQGFRIDPSQPDPDDVPSIVVLGDSVSFGPGVSEPETTVGLLRHDMPHIRFINTSCIGYAPGDYLRVAERTLPAESNLRAVLLFLCLNDVSAASAERVIAHLAPLPDRKAQIKTSPSVRGFHEWLRSRSKLYNLIKSLLHDSQAAYFEADLQPYEQGFAHVATALQPLNEIQAITQERGVAFRVFILPHEAQVRPSATVADFLPQQLIHESLQAAGIDHFDTLPAFRSAGVSSHELFLRGDPVHLSPAGHRVLARVVEAHLPLPPVGPASSSDL